MGIRIQVWCSTDHKKYLYFYRVSSFLLPTSFMLCPSPSHKVSVMSVLRSGDLLLVCSPVEPNSLRLPPGTEDLKQLFFSEYLSKCIALCSLHGVFARVGSSSALILSQGDIPEAYEHHLSQTYCTPHLASVLGTCYLAAQAVSQEGFPFSMLSLQESLLINVPTWVGSQQLARCNVTEWWGLW